jgi:hypothetical protein
MRADSLARLVRTLGVVTAGSGLVSTVRPRLVLGQLAPEQDEMSRHLFATVGVFMVATGGSLHRLAAADPPDRALLGWATALKLGAATAMTVGVARGLYRPRTTVVAAFDFGAGLAGLALWRAVAHPPGEAAP